MADPLAVQATFESIANLILKYAITLAALTLSAAGLVAVVSSEGYSDHAIIPIPGDVPTIGFGTTGGGAATGGGLGLRRRQQLEAELGLLQEQVRLYERGQVAASGVADAQARQKQQVEALAEFDRAGEKFLDKKLRMEREIAQARELEYAAARLGAIEINGTYYSAQSPATFAKWRDSVPDEGRAWPWSSPWALPR